MRNARTKGAGRLIDTLATRLETRHRSEWGFSCTVNDVFVMSAVARAEEDLHPLTGDRFFMVDDAWTERSALIQLLAFPAAGHAHAASGRYDIGLSEEPGSGEAIYFEQSPSGLVRFLPTGGWIELEFAADRTSVEGTFEFDATNDTEGNRFIRRGKFFLPYADLPDPNAP